MVDEPQTYADGRNVLTAIEALNALVESGQANDRQRAILSRLQQQHGAAERQVADTGSSFRGVQRGVTVGLNDNIAGAVNVMRGGTYREGQQEALARDQAAYINNPDAFNRGQFAGTGALAGASMALPAVTGLGLVGQAGLAGAGGAGIGAATGYSDYELEGSPEGEMMNYLRAPTLIGAGTGMASPLVGRAAGAAVRGIRNIRNMDTVPGVGRVPMQTLTRNWQQAADAGMPVDSFLARHTDEAALVDVPGPMQATGQGLASMGGEGGTALARFVNERGDAAGARIAQDMNTHIGPANAAFQARRARAAERTSVLGPQYDAALAATAPVEVGPMVTQLRSVAAQAGPDTGPALDKALRHLEERMDEDGFVDAATLHWARSDLSRSLQEITGPTRSNAMLTAALRQYDDVLDANVPGYAQARTDYANNHAMDRATDEGRNVLRNGRYTAMSPDQFSEYFDTLSDAQKDALRTGLREDIAALMGTARNDAAAAWGQIGRDWNEEKLRIALGESVANDLIKRLGSEETFSQTRGLIVGGSQTDMRRAARENLGPTYADPETGQRPGPIGRARNSANDLANSVVDALIYGNRNATRNLELGQALSATGSNRDRLVAALMSNSQGRRAPSMVADNMDRLVRALIAGGGGSAAAVQN